jgi:uncharacterized protein YndB with AHSA1/START domain
MPSPAAAETSARIAPIVIDLVVRCPPQRAFDYFTRDIGRWWPLESHSVGLRDAVDVRVEPREGGHVVETLRDGSESVWGTVLAWKPGARFSMSWHPGRDAGTAQRVDVAFAPHADGTRVTLRHDGWEALGADASSVRDRYVPGWGLVFEQRFGGYCSAR